MFIVYRKSENNYPVPMYLVRKFCAIFDSPNRSLSYDLKSPSDERINIRTLLFSLSFQNNLNKIIISEDDTCD